MIWQWLTATDVRQAHGQVIWNLIPSEWKLWWRNRLRYHVSIAASVDRSASLLHDVTKRKRTLESAISEKYLKPMMDAVNEHLFFCVKCPWGCSEFFHRTGSLPLDVVIARLLGPKLFANKAITPNLPQQIIKKVAGIREDYLQTTPDDCVLCNPQWMIVPSVAFLKDGAPYVLTCRFHSKGSSSIYIHPPKNPVGTISSRHSNQLAPAVISTRTVKVTKSKFYSNTYQMQEIRAQYNGVDTMRLLEQGKFDFACEIARLQDLIAIVGRSDIQAFLSQANQQCDHSLKYVDVDAVRANAKEAYASRSNDIEKCLAGATFVTLPDALKMQLSLKTEASHYIEVKYKVHEICGRDANSAGETILYYPYWPKYIIHFHCYNKYGSIPAAIRRINTKGRDFRLLWMVAALHSTVDAVWESTVTSIKTNDQWMGWMLMLITWRLFPAKGRGSSTKGRLKNPFPVKKCVTELENETIAHFDASINSDGEVDTEFSVLAMLSLFREHADVNVQRRSNFHWNALEANTRIVIVINDMKLTNNDNFDTINFHVHDDSHWKARFIAFSDDSESLQWNAWKSTIFVRHASELFSNWWQYSYNSIEFAKVGNFDASVRNSNWDFVVFVKNTTQSLQRMKEQFLISIGGQAQVHCEAHHLPLIIASYSTEATCSTNFNCKRKVKFQCPFIGCSISICLFHQKLCVSQGCKYCNQLNANSVRMRSNRRFSVHDNDSSTGEDSFARNDDEFDDSVSIDSSANVAHQTSSVLPFERNSSRRYDDEDNEQEQHEQEEDEQDQDEDEEREQQHELRQEQEQQDEEELFDFQDNEEELDPVWANNHIVEGDDPMFVDDESFDDEDGTVADNGTAFVPSTVAGSHAKKVDKCNISRTLPLHVILNNCGSLLARRTKLKGTTMQQNAVQSLVSTLYGKSIPLLYPEGMLFPSIFWKEHDLAIVGAMPCGMLTSNNYLKKLGVASLKNHFQTRIMDATSLASADEKYISYAFDCLVNLGCRSSDTRLVLNRAMKFNGEGIAPSLSNGKLYECESIDSRPVVNKLAAAMRTEQATYFYTHTCNQSEHFGVCAIKKWIDSPELANILSEKWKLNDRQASFHSNNNTLRNLISCVAMSSAATMLRHWMEVSEIWMLYISESPEQPLGKIVNMWVRHEYQDGEGNLSHLHGLLWVDKSTRSDQNFIENKIKGSILELLSDEDIHALQQQGIINETNTVERILQYAKKVLTHKCTKRCQVLKKRDGVITSACRVVNNGVVNKTPRDHTMQTVNVKHSNAACQILHDLELFDVDANGNYVIVDNKLNAQKHFPPSYAHEGAVSQCNGQLFAATLSSQNLQLITGYLASRYLAKYVAQVDENNKLYIGAGQVDENSLKVEYTYLHNTKISGSKKTLDALHKKRRDANHPCARAISLMEILSIMLNYPQVITDLSFYHVSSSPLEERAGFLKRTTISQYVDKNIVPNYYNNSLNPPDLHTSECLPSAFLRNTVYSATMPKWRKISKSEEITLKDQLLSDVTNDATTIFSIRPPELRFVRFQEDYHKWFYRSNQRHSYKNSAELFDFAKQKIVVNLRESCWIDGLLHQIFIRPIAIDAVLEYLNDAARCNNGSFYSDDTNDQPTLDVVRREKPLYHMLNLFNHMKRRSSAQRRRASSNLDDRPWIHLKERLIGPAEKVENNSFPVIWYNSVRPSNGHRWLLHILLTMGQFDNELNLLSKRNMRESFIHAKLLRAEPEHWENDVKTILKKYVQNQLIHIPGGSQSFDSYLLSAKNTLTSMLINNALPMNETPPCLLSHLREYHVDDFNKFTRDVNVTLITSTLLHLEKKGMRCAPPLIYFLDDSPIPDDVKFRYENLEPTSNQLPSSVAEQQAILQLTSDRMRMYSSSITEQTKSILILGGPGVGKTTVLQMALLLALQEKRYNVALTALMSERANQLGGEHISKLFAIPAKNNVPPHRLAELALVSLMRKPKRWFFLKRLEFLFIDELGQISSELISTLDIILRDIKSSSLFMGGIVTFSTMDPLQLRPITGRPPLVSSHMTSCFDIYKLNVSVRAASDEALQEIQSITRCSVSQLKQDNSFLLERFKVLLATNCTFVDSFHHHLLDDQHLLRIFGKKKATRQAEADFLSRMKSKHRDQMLSVSSQDQESSFDGIWKPITPLVKTALNDNAKEPERLFFFPFAMYEITFNKENCYSQSQIAILAELPTEQQLQNFDPVSVFVAPPGTKYCASDMTLNHDYAAHGWKVHQVGTAPEHIQVIHNALYAKRKQYGLRNRIASTIHASMGQDLLGVVTKISSTEPQYKLWEKEQVVVLLSRTHYCRDIYFVGDVDETTHALASLLLKRSLYSDYLDYILTHMVYDPQDQNNATRQVSWNHHPFRPKDVAIPTDSMGFVYLLMSLRASNVTYIGSTNNVARRLRQHNSGIGSFSTQNVLLRPWALIAFVCGFQGTDLFRQRQNFERTWKQRIQSLEDNSHTIVLPQEIITIGQQLVTTWMFGEAESNLTFVDCGTLE